MGSDCRPSRLLTVIPAKAGIHFDFLPVGAATTLLSRSVRIRNPEDSPFFFVFDSDPPRPGLKTSERRNEKAKGEKWIPAFAGMTAKTRNRAEAQALALKTTPPTPLEGAVEKVLIQRFGSTDMKARWAAYMRPLHSRNDGNPGIAGLFSTPPIRRAHRVHVRLFLRHAHRIDRSASHRREGLLRHAHRARGRLPGGRRGHAAHRRLI